MIKLAEMVESAAPAILLLLENAEDERWDRRDITSGGGVSTRPNLRDLALEALVKIGKPAVAPLIRVFYKKGFTDEV